MHLNLATLENVFIQNNNKPFLLSQKDVEWLFSVKNLYDPGVLSELKTFLELCGICLIFVPKAEVYGFMRVWEALSWPTHALSQMYPNPVVQESRRYAS